MASNEPESTDPSAFWRYVAAVAAAVGAAASLYVLVVTLGEGPETIAGCGGDDGGCTHVLQTRWSRWFGLPVSGLGALLYGALCVLSLRTPTRWLPLAAGAAAALLSGAWFVTLQVAVIGSVCLFCMTTHAAGLGVALALWRARSGSPPPLPHARVAGLALAATALVALGQLLSARPDTHALTTATFEGAERSRTPGEAVYFGGALRLDLEALPVLGDRDAPHVVALIFDFTCPSCRQLSRHLVAAQDRYDGAIAVAEVLTPINRACNTHVPARMKSRGWACDIAKLSCAVFLADREVHREYTDWLTRAITEVPPRVARKRAVKLVGEEALDRALTDPRVQQLIDRGGEIYANLGAGKLPKLVLHDDQVIVGEVHHAEGLFEVLEETFGVVPVEAD